MLDSIALHKINSVKVKYDNDKWIDILIKADKEYNNTFEFTMFAKENDYEFKLNTKD